jgi:5-methylcytosine-specific restriction endonuclease McrA
MNDKKSIKHTCSICGSSFRIDNKSHHLKAIKHVTALNKNDVEPHEINEIILWLK